MKKMKGIDRREFIKKLGQGTAAVAAMMSAGPLLSFANRKEGAGSLRATGASGDMTDSMTYRVNRHTKDKVSLLGYGCMRWPRKEGSRELDQDKINEMVDYAMAHGVNYYDTAPAYGDSEIALGKAIHKYPRNKYFIATKMSNFSPNQQSREASLAMYNNSLKRIQVDYIDYYLLHGIGMGGMASFKARFEDNGILDYLLAERAAGRIRNLGFSYHGDIEVFDYLLSKDIKWDFAQIELNYVDWKHAKDMNPRNTDAEYLYDQLEKHNIQAVIMEPLLGGRLSNVSNSLKARFTAARPADSAASWAFRFAGSLPGVLTVLSGMSKMEHLQDNLHTYSPLDPCTQTELAMLEDVAKIYSKYPMIPCTGCRYCMPCPFSVDIPANFAYYNKCVNDGTIPPTDPADPKYKQMAQAFVDGYNKAVPEKQQGINCQDCEHCLPHCPQHIRIPDQLNRITQLVEDMKKNLA
jgi:predicted aldo/keto reductase-like oxidoreductase